MYGLLFITLGNLSGNAIQFGSYILQAVYGTDSEGNVNVANADTITRLLAIACLATACLLHFIWRKGGIYAICILAIIKFALVFAIFLLGCAASAGVRFTSQSTEPPYHQNRPVHGGTRDPDTQAWSSNFSLSSSFKHTSHQVSNYANSILFIMYTYSGYVQPFYVSDE